MSEVTRLPVRGASPYDVVVGHGVLREVPVMLGSAPQRVAVCFAELVDLADVRVRETRGDAAFVEEHLCEQLVLGEVRQDALDRDELGEAAHTVQSPEVQLRHAALCELQQELVATDAVLAHTRSHRAMVAQLFTTISAFAGSRPAVDPTGSGGGALRSSSSIGSARNGRTAARGSPSLTDPLRSGRLHSPGRPGAGQARAAHVW